MAAEYKVYAIGPDGHIILRIDLVCDDDAAAKERARQLVDAHPIELWRGEDFLGRFEPLS
ncbi:hypothetical protein [Bradyrhizobium sp. McL0615]|uniref:hypothetical protein n=1 Tax=Bradyrhizobium sp. McL0615 TaxID=3415673 RepID=UPI003CED2242